MVKDMRNERIATSTNISPCGGAHEGATLEHLIEARLAPGVPTGQESTAVSDMPTDEIKNRYLSEVDIFRDLNDGELHAIAKQAPMRVFERGHVLFSPRQSVETLFILKVGTVRIFRIGPDGRALTTALLEPGTIFGEMVLLGQHMYDQYAEIMDEATICLMDRGDVHKYLLSNPKIALRVAEVLGRRLIETEQRFSDAVLKTAPQRIASTLHTLARKEYRRGIRSATPNVRITHEQLADLVGTSRETTTKALGTLSENGIIKLGRGKITILKPLALREAGE
ncbi:Crp/Fnr family transcriptional regulator [Natronoglycomyces albus]|uniref:Crp/Fnr family transcriptional regulator n=1 Tax=Natronoglycomyces albus TaxID=2811108 RepID=A0A895XLK1_9ACTN|nr:Crp/Fnr family transcriptional regulator [Natronoglycomyces albus]QSB04672.1 Crp/Fnr family transcriptional regulator [Natronoglycomyces albus]